AHPEFPRLRVVRPRAHRNERAHHATGPHRRPEGVTLADCERVSKSLSALLDQADPLPTRYDLEVSFPGAERPPRNLEEYRRFIGKRSNVRYRVGDSERVAEGRLTAVSDDAIELQLGEGKH